MDGNSTLKPKLSIAMSAYNCESSVGFSIRSIINQTYTDWELILIDDGSQDRTGEICASFSDSRIRLISDGKNRGLTHRLNQAIDLAQGCFIGRMDADDIAFPGRFEAQIRFLQANKHVDLVGCKMLLIDSDLSPAGIQSCPQSHSEISIAPWRVIPVWHPTWCGRASWFRAYRYDSLAGRAEDQDMLRRAMPNSIFANLDDCLLAYHMVDLFSPKAHRSRRSYASSLFNYAVRERSLSYLAYSAAYALGGIPLFYRWIQLLRGSGAPLRPDDKTLREWSNAARLAGVNANAGDSS